MAPVNWLMVGANDSPEDSGDNGRNMGSSGGGGASKDATLPAFPLLQYPSSTRTESTAALFVPAVPITTQTVAPMKGFKAFLIAGAMLAGVLAFGQTDSTIHVKTFPGVTVGQKVAAAQKTCVSAPVPCFLVIDPSLAAAPSGTMPALCGNCQLVDYRSGWPSGGGVPDSEVRADILSGSDWAAKVNNAEARLGSVPGTIIYDAGGATLTAT